MTPEGKHLRSRPVGLSYDDGSNTVLIAELTNSVGYLVDSNQIIYPNAFVGVAASLRYRYTKAGFEQDIVLEGQPPSLEAFGLNPKTARLQVVTEFFNPPQPNVTTATVSTKAGDLTNQELDFGVMKMRTGKAFLLGTNTSSTRVTKQWLNVEGRQFLVEEVPVALIAGKLLQLPAPQTVSTKISPHSPLHVVSAKRLLPTPRLTETVPPLRPMQLGQAVAPSGGLVLDYQTVNSSVTNYTFRGDTTYLIVGPVYLYGAITFEGGAVTKYAYDWCGGCAGSLYLTYPVNVQMQAAPYHPVIFTASDDISVGENTSSEGSMCPGFYYANPAFYYEDWGYCTLTLDNFRIAYAATAISASVYGLTINLYNGQIVDCGTGVYTEGDGSINLKNMLLT
ncbi:MAG: hypothetical protein ABSD57_01585 [Verrucomicrobiota bacterium]